MGTHVRSSPWFLTRDVAGSHRYPRSRRGRRVRLAAGAAGLAVAGLVLIGGAVGGASTPPRHVTVQAGDTLWSIAEAAYGGSDVQARVIQIESANHLASPALNPGAVLTLPAP
jgi:nucleoid-associated protein YgaU